MVFHECVHQLLHLGYSGRFPTRLPFIQQAQNSQIHFWIVEGIACLFETCDLSGGRLAPQLKGARYDRAARRIAAGDREPLVSWMAANQDRFMAGDAAGVNRNYDLAATLCHYFVNFAGGQKYRDRFFQFLSAHYRGDVDLETFQKVFGGRIDLLQAEFEAYCLETWPQKQKGE